VLRVYFVPETAQVELKSGRVKAPAADSLGLRRMDPGCWQKTMV